MDDITNDTTTPGSSNTDADVTAGSKDGNGAADRDEVYAFGRRPSAQAPYPFNERQFARLLIRDEDEKCLGYFDLYHTRRKPLSPYLHGFKDREPKSRLESLWREFTTTTDSASADLLTVPSLRDS